MTASEVTDSDQRTICPDGGSCHHACINRCFRVECCGPLSGVFPDDRWPDSISADPAPETWKSATALGFSKYEVSADGFGPDQQPVRRIDNGKPLKVSVNSSGYPQVKPYNDSGVQRTVLVHHLVLGVWAGPCPEGLQRRHYDDDPWNNRWRPGDEAESVAAGGNLFYGTSPQNIEDGFRNGRPKAEPRPVRHCVLCDAVLTTNGKRCHECVVMLGKMAAPMLRARGPEAAPEIAVELGYPSADGIVKLAVMHGGYGQSRLKRWWQRVLNRGR